VFHPSSTDLAAIRALHDYLNRNMLRDDAEKQDDIAEDAD
jgi:hypothetical protein